MRSFLTGTNNHKREYATNETGPLHESKYRKQFTEALIALSEASDVFKAEILKALVARGI